MNERLLHIAQTTGTPCFVYDIAHVRQRVSDLRSAFGGRFRISYAVKCNPHHDLLRWLLAIVDALDISSGGELRRGMDAGWDTARMSFTGPAKRDSELRAAIEHGVGEVVLESVQEAQRLDDFAARAGRRQRVLLRISPAHVPAGFGVSMSGRPTQFGVDEEDADAALESIRRLGHLDLAGFHIYSGTQCLRETALAQNYLNFIEIFRRLSTRHDLRPGKLIFGSGLGIPYHEQDKPLDLAEVARQTIPALDELRADSRFAQSQLVLETGRYIVGEAGVYLTRIVSAKRSRGVEIRLCDGGMNHHLGAAGHLGSVIQRNYRMSKIGPSPDAPPSCFDLYGPLCTSIDLLARQASFPGLEIGDVVAIHCSGAYGPTASPLQFISHEPPQEVIVE